MYTVFYYHIPYILLIRHVRNISLYIIHMMRCNNKTVFFIIHAVTMSMFSTFINIYLIESWILLKDLSPEKTYGM